WSAEGLRRIELQLIRFNEHGHTNAGGAELTDKRSKTIVLARRVDTAFRRALLALFGNDARRVRFGPERNREHFVSRRHLEIERYVDCVDETLNVGVGNVASVFTQMGCNAVRS